MAHTVARALLVIEHRTVKRLLAIVTRIARLAETSPKLAFTATCALARAALHRTIEAHVARIARANAVGTDAIAIAIVLAYFAILIV